ncbi:hypothetical protein D3C80_1456050 [compost metagenome]
MIPTLPNHQAGNVAAPDLIDCGWLKVTFEQVLGHKGLDTFGSILMAAALPAGQVCFRHEFSDQIPSRFDRLGLQGLRDHSRAGTLPASNVQLHDLGLERITLGIRPRAAMKPVIKRATGNAKSTAKLAGRIRT